MKRGEEGLQEPHAFLAPKTDIIMDICKVPTLQLTVQNKHSITHNIHQMEILSAIKNDTHTHTHTHTHTDT